MHTITLYKKDESKNPRQIRKDGFIPVTVYGRSVPNSLSYQISTQEFSKFGLSRFTHCCEGISDADPQLKFELIIKSIEKHPVTDEIRNIQFHAVTQDEQIKLSIPLTYTGNSPLVQAGGTLVINRTTVDITTNINNLPTHLEFDLKNLAGNKQVAHYYDLALPAGVGLRSVSDLIIAKVSMPQVGAKGKAA